MSQAFQLVWASCRLRQSSQLTSAERNWRLLRDSAGTAVTTPSDSMTDPELEDQLLSLPPTSKIVAGLIVGAAGITACVLLWERGWIAWIAVFAALLGPALAWIGLREQARERAFDAEVAQARADWSELERGIRAARRDGGNVARYIQGKSYREFAVRRWIAAELDPGKRAE